MSEEKMPVTTVTVGPKDDGMRLDRWFRQHYPGLRHGELQKLLRKGQIRVEGGRVQADRRVSAGEAIRIPPMDLGKAVRKPPATPRLKDGDRDYIRSLVIYQDKDIIALNKPAGLAVQGGEKTTRHIDGMLDALSHEGERPRLVHRLDRDTGGVLILGRSRAAAAWLTEAFRRHEIGKEYWALTRRVPHPREGLIDLSVEKTAQKGGERMAAGGRGKKALTDYQVVETAGQRAAFVALRPTTGRTHQIRVHLAAIGCPIVGDRKYGGEEAVMEGLAPKMHLFCRTMRVPRKGRADLVITAPLTAPMDATWALFGFAQPEGLEWPEL